MKCPAVLAATILLAGATAADAQRVSSRGFIEGRAFVFPLDASLDRQNVVVDLLAREELAGRPTDWLRLQAGFEFRANNADQVDDSWQPDIRDRGIRRPLLSVRRLDATVTRGRLTVDAGKQFIRWGKTEIVTPTDRFAPRDYLNVFDTEYLAVPGVRVIGQLGAHSLDAVWVPVFTPSRIPLSGKRWTVLPPEAPPVEGFDRAIPEGRQAGIRWGYVASGYEVSASFFDGFNHLPVVEPTGPLSFRLTFPSMRMYGGDAVVPSRWVTIKGEGGYFTSDHLTADDYVLYVIELERQQGELLVAGGFAGEHVTHQRAFGRFAPDRGMTRAFIGRASYTIDPNRSAAVETAVRANLDGMYLKAEYTQARGDHWRTTVATAVLGGEADDFLGQYRRNSHVVLSVRYSF
jgi:hypothetical protein